MGWVPGSSRCFCRMAGAGRYQGHPHLWWVMSSSVLAAQRALPKGCFTPGVFAELMVLAGGCPSVLTLLVIHPEVPSCCSPACCSVAGTGVGAAGWVPCRSWGVHRLAPSCVSGCNGNPQVFGGDAKSWLFLGLRCSELICWLFTLGLLYFELLQRCQGPQLQPCKGSRALLSAGGLACYLIVNALTALIPWENSSSSLPSPLGAPALVS